MSKTGPVVETHALGRRFGSVVAVADLSITIAPGETFALIGPNGAGKSSLMKMLTTLLPPTAGEARVAGYDITREPQQVRRHIGYVPQLPSADTELTGYENMLLSARLYLLPARERRPRIAEALALMELSDARDRAVGTYSGGMARRLEIAQSTLHRPAVLFLDEPTVGLDPNGRLAVWDHVRRLRRETGAAIVFSTHYMEEAEDLADRVALISRGRLAAVGTVAELKNAHGAASLDALFTKLTGAALSPTAVRP
ncbi:ATP-binding cassette domain-containing protein [Sphingomonas sp. H39-1-10]|uniref:ABC transporter ATP-binding protein n=1 Tax=Sphingomonas pollutisoli TaxID=3030829 RepID=UPI0023B9B860|nr:ATP-binding cassette domain-containing protein [Sphingomonas pollutisoli]MDF0488892.1 ATP-binding cassette domain-containing protein [Sphingomonas pollutisoli]